MSLLERAHRHLHDALVVISSRTRLVLGRRDAEEQNGADAGRSDLGCLGYQLGDREALDMREWLDTVDVEPELKTLFFLMGYTHYCIHAAEVALKKMLGTSFAVEDLEEESKANHWLPFGVLVQKLRQRVEVDEDLEDSSIRAFLRNRNILVHHLTEEIALGVPRGLIDAAEFCNAISIQARRITVFFEAAMLAEKPTTKFEGNDPEEVEAVTPFIHLVFRRRE